MKNTTEKKINWKKVAALGGMFAVGVVVGVVGGEAVIGKLAEDGDAFLGFSFMPFNGKECLKVTMRSDLTGRELWIPLDKDFAHDALDVFTGMVEKLEK